MTFPEVLAILRCPATGQALRPATAEEKERLGIPAGENALASEDGACIYRAPDGLPLLLSAKDVTVGDAG